MNKELLISSSSNNINFALLKDGKLIEYHKDNENTKFLVGDIYLAKIRKSLPALNAAFEARREPRERLAVTLFKSFITTIDLGCVQ